MNKTDREREFEAGSIQQLHPTYMLTTGLQSGYITIVSGNFGEFTSMVSATVPVMGVIETGSSDNWWGEREERKKKSREQLSPYNKRERKRKWWQKRE